MNQLLSIPYHIRQGWLGWYHQADLAEVLLRTPGGSPGKPVLLTAEQHEQLRAEVDTGRFHTVKEVATWIEEQWKVTYTPDGIYSLFRRLGITKKIPRRQSGQADESEKKSWKKGSLGQTLNAVGLRQGERAMHVDEMRLGLQGQIRRVWVSKGLKVAQKPHFVFEWTYPPARGQSSHGRATLDWVASMGLDDLHPVLKDWQLEAVI